MPAPVHPGRILKEEIQARRLAPSALALALGVPAARISAILRGQRGISPDTALRLARFFRMSAEFWMNLQTQHDLALAELRHGAAIARTVKAA